MVRIGNGKLDEINIDDVAIVEKTFLKMAPTMFKFSFDNEKEESLNLTRVHHLAEKMLATYYTIAKVVYMMIAVSGVPVNVVAIVILARGKCGLSSCTTRYLVAMAMADLLVIFTEVILLRVSYFYFPGSFLDITPVCCVTFSLSRSAKDCSVWFTLTFSFDRFVAICCHKLKTKYCNERNAYVVVVSTCILLCLKNIPFYFAYEAKVIIDNIPWYCYVKPSYFTETGWIGFDWFDTVLNPLFPFVLLLIINTLTVRYILVSSRVRKSLMGQSKGENCSDPEMESRRRSVILLFSISGSFILLWLTYVVYVFYYNISATNPSLSVYNTSYILSKVGFMLVNLSCCTNTFIYVVTQSKFREQFKNAIKHPLQSIIRFINA
ncbi:probable G-protein coupled receptor 139 [Chiloscyllium punctatum]|uniref:probable G-protein coupled receptor 139 n=1 Tax=Chiloscyllium punctatum TaxID=137246 RepID=UPI003B63D288